MKHLLILISLIALVLPSHAEGLQHPDQETPVGWASVEGLTTGSNDDNPVLVNTLAELEAAFNTARHNTKKNDDAKMTIYIQDTIETSGIIFLQDAKNITIYGLPGSALVNPHRSPVDSTGILVIKRCENIILRNITFKGAGAYDIDGNDNLTIQSSNHIWIDHCDFQDGIDGNFDCSLQSNNISVTWCRFRYLVEPKEGGKGGSNDHRFSNLWGSSDKANDDGFLNTTFACCWWDEGCRERMPRIRYGRIHILNCLYTSSATNYAVGIGYKARTYIENTVFDFKDSKPNRVWKYASTSGKNNHSFIFRGCKGICDSQHAAGEEYFIPARIYDYTALPAEEVRDALTNEQHGAGATLDIRL